MDFNVKEKYHLSQRAEFFVHHQQLDTTTDRARFVDGIFDRQVNKSLFIKLPKWNPKSFKNKSEKQKREIRKERRQQAKQLNYLWFKQMLDSDKGFIEKMTLFWHGHFACRTIDDPYLTLEMNNLLRNNALGNFKTLLFAVAKSASMINYLHLRQNKKGQANEDFARELCELFTLGRDVDYTEKDVSEIARAFTGWRTDEYGKHLVVDRIHDNGEKTIFGKTGNFNGEDVLNMLLDNKHTSDFIVTKVYKFFVKEDVNKEHIKELSAVFYDSKYDITSLMKFLFNADWFYESKGQLIKGPIEFLVGFGKMFDLKYPHQKAIQGIQYYLGQVLFDPPNVAGCAGGRHWIDASRFALRLRLPSLILNRGYVMDELSPELDEMLAKKQKKQDFKFSEPINWDQFWKNNKEANLFDLLIRNENNQLKENHKEVNNTGVIHLLSTPDFQLT
ncbi:MAG: DUF1800 domain-containing protein [Fluviicola sp.]|nr:DUF1800 domain-containing protein [Fluviicola sp.]